MGGKRKDGRFPAGSSLILKTVGAAVAPDRAGSAPHDEPAALSFVDRGGAAARRKIHPISLAIRPGPPR
ncbi:hypothetical protein GCM10010464_08000 [Pseudonocardia yunnanensis]|uniref:Uncharacterized protein n=1 Tax=Pseudonocardia yunnanensis TaxID=58107 RepID=A0ABW4ENT1_9PSEU